jgi:hypothetical protein
MTCTFPNCRSNQVRDGYCIGHAKMMTSIPVPKKTKPIPKKSEGRKDIEKDYRKLVGQTLKKQPFCQVKATGCTNIAQGLHHIKKRTKENMCDPDNVIPCCNACNLWIEENPIKAIEMGVSKSKFNDS